MSSKKCSYKGCGSFTNSSHPSQETFYSFPKHPERLKIWMKLGGCVNEKELSYGARYFCSKHFDETKYVASNPRRKQLLSTAVPYSWMDSAQQNNISIVDEGEYQCVVSSVDNIVDEYDPNESIKIHDDDDDITDEVANEIGCISESVETLENFDDFQNEVNCPTDFEEEIEVEKRSLKRKVDHSIIKQQILQPAPSKRSVAIVSNRPTSTINLFQHQKIVDEAELYEETDLISAPAELNNITTFIFKGEEYVQMPKEQYNREKMALINKIRSYEDILKSCKNLIDTAKI